MNALVLGVGGLRGAYDAGVAATLCRELGHDYFDAIYASSAGVFTGTFYAANQPDIIEEVWRNDVSGSQLINWLNPLDGRNILDTEYLTELFRSDKRHLDVDAALTSGVKLWYAIENLETAKVEYFQPTEENIFTLMRASSAVPLVHEPVEIDSVAYVDGGLSAPLPVDRAQQDGYEEIVAVYNKPGDFYDGRDGYVIFLDMVAKLVDEHIQKQVAQLDENFAKLEKKLAQLDNTTVIRPDVRLPVSLLETRTETVNEVFDVGVSDAQSFLKNMSL